MRTVNCHYSNEALVGAAVGALVVGTTAGAIRSVSEYTTGEEVFNSVFIGMTCGAVLGSMIGDGLSSSRREMQAKKTEFLNAKSREDAEERWEELHH